MSLRSASPKSAAVGLDAMVDTMKAAGESSRLRILLLLARGDLTVTDLTEILGQSQPRVSRHLKVLLDAGLIDRYQEGSWAFFRLAEEGPERAFATAAAQAVSAGDAQVERDFEKLGAVKARRRARAADYFRRNAASWDDIRSLHAPDQAVETALKRIVGGRPFQAMLDLGTGTGRLLEILSPLYRRGVGIDMSREMLAVARANLDNAGIANALVRQGDIYAPPVERDAFDLVTVHQVLHYLDDPALAVREAAKMLRAGGRLVIVDFAPHDLEFLREERAHLRLGFADAQIAEWLTEAGLEPGEVTACEPGGNADAKKLTVKLWVGQDRRILMADPFTKAHNSVTETA